MYNKNILDDNFDWEEDPSKLQRAFETTEEHTPVVMLRTFNTEEQAYLAAATLHAEGIEAHVVSAATGQMTPFAYGNIRLFVAATQASEATNILKETDAQQTVYEQPKTSSMAILILIILGIFLGGLVFALLGMSFKFI